MKLQMFNARLSPFYVRSGIFTVLSLSGAALNYALYPILVRLLSTEDFGDFATIIAISNQVLGILLAFNILSIYLVKVKPEAEARKYAQILQQSLIKVFLAMTAVVLACSPFLQTLLKIDSLASFFVLTLILLFAIPPVIWTGYLQGHKELIRVGLFNFASALTKLVLVIALVILFGPVAGLWGVLGGTLAGLVVLRLSKGVKLPHLTSIFSKSESAERIFLKSLRSYTIGAIFVVGSLSFLQNVDITLAKAMFGPEQAGIYSGVSILSNALYYVAFLLVWIILPEVKIGDRVTNQRVLTTGYKLLAVLACLALLTQFVMRSFLAQTLLGEKFASQGQLLFFASAYQLSLVALTLYAYYLLVIRSRKALVLAATTLLSCLVIPAVFSNTTEDMIKLLWLSLVIGFGLYQIIGTLYGNRKPTTH